MAFTAARDASDTMSEMNITPLVDVMLVLLVIFMVTAPLITGQVELPSVGSKLAAPVQPLEVTLRSDQSLWLRDMAATTSPVRLSKDELIARVKEAQARRADQAVVIAADRNARYEDVLGVLDLLQRNGVKKVGLLARQPS